MKIVIIITLIVVATIIYFLVLGEIAFGVLAFFVLGWLVWRILEIKVKRHYKQLLRFRWYNKMGMLESGYFVEPEYAIRYWWDVLNERLK